MTDQIIRRLVLLFALIALVFVAVAFVAVRNISRAAAASDWVNHTHAVILELGELRSSFQASDAALRTLAMTGNEQDEAACREALSAMSEHLEVTRALTRGESGTAAQVVRLEKLAAARSELTRDVLAARKGGQTESVRSLLAADTGAGVSAEVRRIVEKLKLEQMGLLAERDRTAFVQAQTTRWTVWAGVGLNFVLLGLTAWLVVDGIAARRRAAAVLQTANEQLEVKVQERTADLVAANELLKAENLERRWGEQALEHQIRYNELIIHSISDLVLVVTKARNISRLNTAVLHATGWEPAELINRPLADLVRLQDSSAQVAAGAAGPLGQALKEGRDFRDAPALVTDRHRREMPARLTLFPLRDGNKVVGGIVILRLDATPA